MAGLLGRPLSSGLNRVRLADLDAALRASAARRGLASVLAALTGSPLRDRPGERTALTADRREVWQHLDSVLVEAGLAERDWVPAWTTHSRPPRSSCAPPPSRWAAHRPPRRPSGAGSGSTSA
jgi:Protein of unknown function N-terminus (DUF3323)